MYGLVECNLNAATGSIEQVVQLSNLWEDTALDFKFQKQSDLSVRSHWWNTVIRNPWGEGPLRSLKYFKSYRVWISPQHSTRKWRELRAKIPLSHCKVLKWSRELGSWFMGTNTGVQYQLLCHKRSRKSTNLVLDEDPKTLVPSYNY